MKLELSTIWLGHKHEHHDTLGSTNDRAAQWAREGAPHGALVTADAQSEGRGRRGRAWHSARGLNVYASLVLRPRSGTALGALGLAVGVGLAEGLAGVDVRLKWPNDLLVGGRKLGGILCESRWVGQQAEVVVGFGINVQQQSFPHELRPIATSLADLGVARDRAEVLAMLLGSLEPVLDAFGSAGFESCRARYEALSSVVGRAVEVEGQRLHVEAFADDGALLGRTASGEQLRIRSGDISVPPPAPAR